MRIAPELQRLEDRCDETRVRSSKAGGIVHLQGLKECDSGPFQVSDSPNCKFAGAGGMRWHAGAIWGLVQPKDCYNLMGVCVQVTNVRIYDDWGNWKCWRNSAAT